jgi:succinate dehydrogenase/fumarate reductase flavoprotein subunit
VSEESESEDARRRLMVEEGRCQGVLAIQITTGKFTLMQAKAVIIAAGDEAAAEEREQQGADNG